MANATTSTMVIDPFIDNIMATIAMCRLYLIVGILVTIVNFASLLVIVLNREMLQKYLYFAVLDIGETINGIAFVVTGAMRAELVTSHAFDQPISYSDCFFQKVSLSLSRVGKNDGEHMIGNEYNCSVRFAKVDMTLQRYD